MAGSRPNDPHNSRHHLRHIEDTPEGLPKRLTDNVWKGMQANAVPTRFRLTMISERSVDALERTRLF